MVVDFFFFFKAEDGIRVLSLFFFFFKQKTAYEIGVRLVGSEMCIRDSESCAESKAPDAQGAGRNSGN